MILLQILGELVVLFMLVGVDIEYEQIFFAPHGQGGRFAVEIEKLQILHLVRYGDLFRLDVLGIGLRADARACQQQE